MGEKDTTMKSTLFILALVAFASTLGAADRQGYRTSSPTPSFSRPAFIPSKPEPRCPETSIEKGSRLSGNAAARQQNYRNYGHN